MRTMNVSSGRCTALLWVNWATIEQFCQGRAILKNRVWWSHMKTSKLIDPMKLRLARRDIQITSQSVETLRRAAQIFVQVLI